MGNLNYSGDFYKYDLQVSKNMIIKNIPSFQKLINAKEYLLEQPAKIIEDKFPLDLLDIKKLEGIQEGINLFKGVSMPEIKFLAKWFEVLNLSRGCNNSCGHCLRNAQTPIKEIANAVNTIQWDDFLKFTDGFKTLNERLGFNIFKKDTPVAMFDDSNMPVFKSFDTQGLTHNFAEATKVFYEKLHLPMSFVNAGWSKNDKNTQNAAKELVEYLQKEPDAVSEFAVSINPFHALILNSNKVAKSGEPELARKYREAYVDNIANALNTFLPMYENSKSTKGSLIYRHANDLAKNEDFGEKETAKLYAEIYKKLEEISGKKLEHINTLNPKEVTKFNPSHLIEPKGKARQYFSDFDNFKKEISLNKAKNEWEEMSPAQKVNDAYNYKLKCIDLNGRVYATDTDENIIDTGINLNYANKDKITAPLHSDIKLSPILKEDIINQL